MAIGDVRGGFHSKPPGIATPDAQDTWNTTATRASRWPVPEFYWKFVIIWEGESGNSGYSHHTGDRPTMSRW
jgi:hypothetical protein